jgi:ABC-type sugar transport system ATPase subunit
MNSQREPVMEVCGISKSFGGNPALQNVSAVLRAGEVFAILGHNGAGKSTLIKILAGVLAADAGKVVINGQELHADVRSSQAAGIAVIYQDLSLFPHLSVSENIAGSLAGKILYSRARAAGLAKHALSQLGIDGTSHLLETVVGELPVGVQQQVAIARAIARDARILILDEPTASLAAKEAGRLLEVVRGLAQRGVAIIFVSHRMGEVRAIADRFVVLSNGAVTLQSPANECSDQELAEALFGGRELRAIPNAGAEAPAAIASRANSLPGKSAYPLLEAESCTRKGEFENISFCLHGGEVTVLTGVVGSGRTEFAQAVFGLRRLDSGSFRVGGQKFSHSRPQSALAAGLAYVPENRQTEGLFLPFSVGNNLASATLNRQARWGLLRGKPAILDAIRSFSIDCKGPKAPLWSLSGGNQQKVLLAKWMETTPQIMILDEPTTGVDITAKSEIHHRIRALAERGKAVLVISSDLDEVLELADRVLVFRHGRLALDCERASMNRQKIMQSMLGISGSSDAFSGEGVSPV